MNRIEEASNKLRAWKEAKPKVKFDKEDLLSIAKEVGMDLTKVPNSELKKHHNEILSNARKELASNRWSTSEDIEAEYYAAAKQFYKGFKVI
ncbi:MAG: hypothetical protein HKO92_06510 [Flavobacteriaceae bacterium]|nr:hypothetical protein [Flavobacteriaceae bacterium]